MAAKAARERRARQGFFEGTRDLVIARLILVLASVALCAIGLVMVYSSSMVEALNNGDSMSSYLVRQAIYALLGFILAFGVARFIPYRMWNSRLLDLFYITCLLLLFATALFGTVALGAKRALSVGGFNIQPAEFAKIALVLLSARIMYRTRLDDSSSFHPLIRMLVFVVAAIGVIYLTQSDLGTSAICAVGVFAVLWLAGVPVKNMLIVASAVVAFGLVALFTVGYRTDRMAFLNPYADPLGTGYQLIRSFYAFADGGIFGVGLGNSTSKYLYLPEAETDFIFAIIGEEFGLVGAIIVVALYAAILYAGLRIAGNCDDLLGTMIAGGCTVMLVFQAFLNIMCVLGVCPTTGKPLPFLSYGGSSMLSSAIIIGIVLSVSFSSGGPETVYDRRRADLRIVHAVPDNGIDGVVMRAAADIISFDDARNAHDRAASHPHRSNGSGTARSGSGTGRSTRSASRTSSGGRGNSTRRGGKG